MFLCGSLVLFRFVAMLQLHLARGELAGVHNIIGLLNSIVLGSVERRTWHRHQPGTGRFEDTEG